MSDPLTILAALCSIACQAAGAANIQGIRSPRRPASQAERVAVRWARAYAFLSGLFLLIALKNFVQFLMGGL